MPNISTLTVNLVAETARFTASLKKSRRDADKFGRAVKKSLTAITSVAAVAGAALLAMGRQSVKAADQIGKTAKAVGLSAETLQELRFAAKQSGVDIRGLDDSVRRFNRRLGEFATSGGGPSAKAIQDLGVSIRDTNGQVRSSEAVFNDVVDAMVKIESQAQRAGLAAQLFGDDFGPKLTPLLDKGTAGIEELRKEARDLGIVLSNETVAGAERAEDTFSRLEAIVRGRMIKAFADNAKTIETATEAIIQFTISTFEAFNSLRQFLGFQTEQEKLIERQNELLKERARIQKTLDSGQFSNLPKSSGSSGLLGISGSDITAQVDAIRAGAEGARSALAGTDAELADIDGKLRAIEETRRNLESLGSERTGASGGTFGTGGFGEFGEFRRQAESIRESLKTPTEQLFEFMDKLDELQELDLLTAEEAFEAFGDKSSEVFESMRRDTKKTTTEVNQLFVQLGTDVSRDLEDFFFSKWDEGVEGMESVFIGAIRRMVSKLLTSQLLNFFGGFGDTFGALFSGGKASGSLGPAAALGGFRRGSPFIAGENGPELISPGAGSTVTPIGATFSFETNINGGSDLNAATLIPILEDNNRKLKSEFLTDLRDGAFA